MTTYKEPDILTFLTGFCLQILGALAQGMGALVSEELAATALFQGAQAQPVFGSRPEAGSDLTEIR
jgi:hypothetical protein